MIFRKPIFPKDKEKEIREILEIDTSQIKDDVFRFSIEAIQKFFGVKREGGITNAIQ